MVRACELPLISLSSPCMRNTGVWRGSWMISSLRETQSGRVRAGWVNKFAKPEQTDVVPVNPSWKLLKNLKLKKKTATLDYQIYLVAVNIFWQSAQENTEQLCKCDNITSCCMIWVRSTGSSWQTYNQLTNVFPDGNYPVQKKKKTVRDTATVGIRFDISKINLKQTAAQWEITFFKPSCFHMTLTPVLPWHHGMSLLPVESSLKELLRTTNPV